MLIHNSRELKQALLPKIKQAVGITQAQAYNIIDDVLQQFYNEYTPEYYKRTNQLLRSLVCSKIEELPNGYRATVYFDYKRLKYKRWKNGEWTGADEMDFGGVRGLHGYKGKNHSIPIKGSKFWSTPQKEISDKIIETLLKNLKSAGIPIK